MWAEKREVYKEAIHSTDLPYTSVEEHVMVLSREADRVVERLETGPYTEKEHQTLLDTLHKIFDRLDTTNGQPRRASIQLASEPQLIGVLERLTLTLTPTEDVSGSVKLDKAIERFKELALPPSSDNPIQTDSKPTEANKESNDERQS